MYGPVASLGLINASLIIAQLFLAGLMVLLLDELIQKGYGLGSGISLFIATNICKVILWKSLAPVSIKTDDGTEYEGAIIALFHNAFTKTTVLQGISRAFFRQNAPNLCELIATIIVIFTVIYFQGFRVEISLSSRKMRGFRQPYPIRMFYTSSVPIILQTALVQNIYFLSQILDRNFHGNFLVGLLGKWQESDIAGHQAPIGGLAYYVSPPQSFFDITRDPIR